MCNKAALLEKYQMALEEKAQSGPLDYIQLRNQEALREWRMKLAFGSTRRPVPAKLRFTQRTRERMHELLSAFHGHPA